MVLRRLRTKLLKSWLAKLTRRLMPWDLKVRRPSFNWVEPLYNWLAPSARALTPLRSSVVPDLILVT